MTEPTDLSNDPIRAFSVALSPAARSHLRLDFVTIPVIRQAVERTGLTPRKLAERVGTGIGYDTPANAWGLLWYRLRRDAGLDDDTEPATPDDAERRP